MNPVKTHLSLDRLERLSDGMQRAIDGSKIAGVVTLVAQRGEVVFHRAQGMAEIESRLPMQADTLFRIKSMTKPVTCAALLLLMEEGRLRLSDPVSRYLPAFKQVQVISNPADPTSALVSPQREISLLDVLTHTAGLSYGLVPGLYLDDLYRQKILSRQYVDPQFNLQVMMEELAQLPLAYQPGATFAYSMATDVVAAVVEVVSGQSLDAFMTERILNPLGMKDTGFMVPTEKLDRFCAVYGPDGKGGLKVLDPLSSPRYTRPPLLLSGGGGLVSTANDYFRFAQMLLNGGEFEGVRVLGCKTVERMRLNHLQAGVHPFNDPAFGYGLGLGVMIDPVRTAFPGSVGVFGWPGVAGSDFWVDPQEELVGILMMQFMPSQAVTVAQDFRNLVYQALVD